MAVVRTIFVRFNLEFIQIELVKISLLVFFISSFQCFTQTMSTTALTVCSGTYYDPGGTNNYGNSQSVTQVINPGSADKAIQIDFTAFDLETAYDFLYIYDGNSTSAPLIGQFTGAIPLGKIIASPTNATGSLTLRFTSDSGTNKAGWTATISCIDKSAPCSVQVGANVNGVYTYSLPFDRNYNYGASESIYLASEINAGGLITSIGWHIARDSRTIPANVDIYMKQTTATTVGGTASTSGYTLVYSGFFNHSVLDWNVVNLQTPFNYTGNNIAVLVVNKTGNFLNPFPDYSYSTVATDISSYYGSDSDVWNDTRTMAKTNIRANMKFHFKPEYKAEWTASNVGINTWCPGESRSVDITVKNVGTQTWTSGWAPPSTINFAWWGSWQSGGGDSNPRMSPFSGLAPGQSQTISFTVTAPTTPGTYTVYSDVVRDGFCWFSSNAGGCGPCNTAFNTSIVVTGAQAAPTLTSSPALPVCGGPVTLTATSGGLGGPTNVAGSLVAYYPFYNNLNDASGSGLNLTGSGGSFTNGGLQLTTASSYNSATTAVLNTDYHTIAFYMKYTDVADASFRRIFGYSSGGSDRSPGLWKTPSTYSVNKIHWRYDPGNTGSSEAQTYNLNQWYYVVGVKNGGEFKIYVDGVLTETIAVASPKSSGTAALSFGGAPVVLREFKVFNKALSATETAQLGEWKWYSGSCGGTLVGKGPNITVNPSAATTYYLRVENACGNSACVSATVNAVSGNPAVFGTNEWIVYGYNGNNTTVASNTYRGYYVQPALSGDYGISTTNFWSNVNSPSYAGTTIDNGNLWTGCSVNADVHTFIHKRKGFPCGTYVFNATGWDDRTEVYVNGTQVWSCAEWNGAGTCTGTMGTHQLDGNSEVEFRTFEGAGGANLNVSILKAVPTTLSPNGASRTCVVSGGTSFVDFVDASGRLIGSVNPNGNNLGSVTMTSYVSAPVTVQACGTTAPSAISAALGRRWVATPQYQPNQNGNPNNPVYIRLPFDDTPTTGEYASLVTAANATINITDNLASVNGMRLSKYSGPLNVDGTASNNCVQSGGSGGTTIHSQSAGSGPANGTVVSLFAGFNANAKYVTYQVPGFSEFWLHGSSSASPLPVELIQFSVNCENEAKVYWSTASERNSHKFVVEKSRDMIHWTVVEELAAADNSSTQLDYFVIDPAPYSGTSYYRLVQFDNDGAEKKYNPVSVSCNAPGNDISVYPNPTQGGFTVEISSAELVKDAGIQIIDLAGKLVYDRPINLTEGINQVYFENHLEMGTYLIKVISDKKQFNPEKIVVN